MVVYILPSFILLCCHTGVRKIFLVLSFLLSLSYGWFLLVSLLSELIYIVYAFFYAGSQVPRRLVQWYNMLHIQVSKLFQITPNLLMLKHWYYYFTPVWMPVFSGCLDFEFSWLTKFDSSHHIHFTSRGTSIILSTFILCVIELHVQFMVRVTILL